MKDAGISKGVVIGRQVPNDAASVPNDDVLDMARKFPDKIIPFGSLDITRGVSATLDELERCIEGGIKGIAMEPAYAVPPRKADANVLYPLYARCEKAGIPMVLTLSFFQGTLEFSDPCTVQHVANDFPNLQIVVAHGCYPWIPMIFQVAITNKNVWLLPDLYMHVETFVGRELYARVLSMTQGRRVIFGSAYPYRDRLALLQFEAGCTRHRAFPFLQRA